MQKITITNDNGKVSYVTEGSPTFNDTILLLFSTVQAVAKSTIDGVTKKVAAEKKPSKTQLRGIQQSVQEDVADVVNYVASNVLNEICPKDPNLQLSEEAIAGAENLIIKYAAENKLTLKEALKIVDKILAEAIQKHGDSK